MYATHRRLQYSLIMPTLGHRCGEASGKLVTLRIDCLIWKVQNSHKIKNKQTKKTIKISAAVSETRLLTTDVFIVLSFLW